MRTNNANFEAANSSASKSLRLVVAITFDVSNIIYFTSHADITITGETTVDDVLRKTSSTSQRINPVTANATIGAITFELLDYSGAVTTVFRDQLQTNDNGLKGKKAELYLGYEGLAWSDYRLEQTQIIDKSVTYKDGIYQVSCRDIQRETRKDILEPAKTRLSASVAPGQDTIEVFDTTGFSLVPHGTSYTLDPSDTKLYCKIKTSSGYEIISATGMTATQLTGVERGLFGTQDQAHEVGSSETNSPEVIEYIYLEMPAAKLAYALLTGSLINQGADVLPDDYHLGVDPNWVDIDSFTGIGSELYDATDDTLGRKVRFEGLKKTDGKRFIEQQLLLILGCVMRILPNGKLSLTRVGSVLTGAPYVAELNETNITKYSSLKYDLSNVRNRLDVKWSWIELQNGDKDFYRTNSLIDGDSITRYGETGTKELKFYGLHSEVHTASLIQDMFNVFRDLVAGPAARLTQGVLPSMNDLETGDVVRVNNPHLRDHTGLNALDRSMEIQGKTVDQLTQAITLQLYGSTQQASLLDNSSGGGTSNELPDNWYCYEGTDLETQVSVTANVVDGNATLVGNADISSGIYYFLGDLTIPTGVTLTITENVELRVMGFLTINGTIDGKGRGLVGRSGAVPEVPESYQGRVGFIGDTRAGGAVYRDSNGYEQEEGTLTRGNNSEFPDIPIINLGGTFQNVISDLRGTSGSQGWDSFDEDRHSGNTSYPKAPGGDGGDGGAGLRIVCRGMGFGANGRIDLSGDDGLASTEGDGVTADIYGGAGAGGAPGGLDIWIDGTGNTVPALYSANFHAFVGDSPTQGTALPFGRITEGVMNDTKPASSYFEGFSTFNHGISAARIRFVPESEITYPIFTCGGPGGGSGTPIPDSDYYINAENQSTTNELDQGTEGGSWAVDANVTRADEGIGDNSFGATTGVANPIVRNDNLPVIDGGDFSCSFWVRLNGATVTTPDAAGLGVVLSLSCDWANRGFYCGINTAPHLSAGQARVTFFLGNGSTGLTNVGNTGNTSLSDQGWHQIGFTYDDATGEIKRFLDGTRVSTGNVGAGYFVQNQVPADLTVLGRNRADESPTNVNMDEIKIWDSVVTEDEMSEEYTRVYNENFGAVVPQLSISPSSLTEAADNGAHTTASVTATPTDITPTTWAWTFVSGSPDITVDTPAASSTTFSSNGYDVHRTTVFRVRATDADGNYVDALIEVTIQHGQLISITPANLVENVANGANTTATVTATANNMVEPVTYEWQRIYGTSEIIAAAPNSDTTAFSSNGTDIAYSAQFRVTATDANNDQVSTTMTVSVIHGTLS